MATTLTEAPAAPASALRFSTKVLPGNRIELADPALAEGEAVDVIVLIPRSPATVPVPTTPGKPGVWDFIKSLPPGPRSAETWEEIERSLQEERDSWDD